MNKYIQSLIYSLLVIFVLTSCANNDYMELDKGSTPLKISTSQLEVNLNEAYYSEDALELNWTSGTNYGTGNKIYYKLELSESESNFDLSYVVFAEQLQVYNWKNSVEALNNIMLNQFGASPGVPHQLQARITATVAEHEEDIQTSICTFTVTPYEPQPEMIYLIGGATPNGWNVDNATAMTLKKKGVFSWTGRLKAGEFKFIINLGSILPSINKDDNGNIVLRVKADDPDILFNVEQDGYYKIDANLFTKQLVLSSTTETGPAFDCLYFVGNPTGWSFDEMIADAIDPYLFRYGKYFSNDAGGEFKFGTTKGSWDNMYKAISENAPYTQMEMIFSTGPDNKWFLKNEECEKAYKICVDIREGKERMMMREFTPYDMIYLVGSAAPNGWDIDKATPMLKTEDAYIFTWNGTLQAGELKITCDKKSDWNGAWFMPSSSDKEPSGKLEQMLFINKSDEEFKSQYLEIPIAGVDHKWKIANTGNYTILLDQLRETITIVKQ